MDGEAAIDQTTRRDAARARQPPARAAARSRELAATAIAALCPAGSMIVFDSTLWHAAGANRSGRDRLTINQQFTRSFVKPQIDDVRARPRRRTTTITPA